MNKVYLIAMKSIRTYQPELAHNGDLAQNETLKNLWQWLQLSRTLVDDGTISNFDNKHPGVR